VKPGPQNTILFNWGKLNSLRRPAVLPGGGKKKNFAPGNITGQKKTCVGACCNAEGKKKHARWQGETWDLQCFKGRRGSGTCLKRSPPEPEKKKTQEDVGGKTL